MLSSYSVCKMHESNNCYCAYLPWFVCVGGGGSGGTVTLEINADLLPVTSICREEVTRNACTHRVRGQLISYCNEGTGALRSLH